MLLTVRKSPVAQLIASKRSCTLVNGMIWGSSSCFDSTEVGIVDEADAMVKREAGIHEEADT